MIFFAMNSTIVIMMTMLALPTVLYKVDNDYVRIVFMMMSVVQGRFKTFILVMRMICEDANYDIEDDDEYVE